LRPTRLAGAAGAEPHRSLPGNSGGDDATTKERQGHRETTMKTSMILNEK
jgi:hypothetical protein